MRGDDYFSLPIHHECGESCSGCQHISRVIVSLYLCCWVCRIQQTMMILYA